MDAAPPPPPPESPPPSSDDPASDQPEGDGAEEADASASPAGDVPAEGAERDLGSVREQLRALKELNEEGLLNEAVYLMQQEILLAQLFGQPTPTLRLADASPPGLPAAAGEAVWAEPPPRGVLGPAGGAAPQRAGATETDSDDDAWPAGGPGPEADKLALPRPRGSRRRTRTTGRRAGESKQARRPKPGGRSRRAAGPPYRDDPIGPLPTTQPEPEPQADIEPEPEPNPEPAPAPKRRTAVGVRGACRICGETSKCQCVHDDGGDAAPLPTTSTERRRKEPRAAAAAPSATAALGTATSEYDFVAPTSEYLSLTKGCDVVVTGVHDEDWLLGYRVESEGRGRKKRKSRRFPSCCVVVHAETGDAGAGGGPLPTPTNDPPPPPAPDSEEEDFGAAENAPPPPLWDPTGDELGEGEAGAAAAGATEEPKGKGRVVTSQEIVQRRQVGSLSRLPFLLSGSRWLR